MTFQKNRRVATIRVGWLSQSRTEAHHFPEEPFPKAFDPAGQTRRLFREQGFRLFTTCVFAAIFVATLKICEKQGSIDNMAMRLFNSIMMCLTLILGLNFFVSALLTFRIRLWSNVGRDIRKHSRTWLRSYDGKSWPVDLIVFVKWT